MNGSLVAILGTRYRDLSVEERVLEPYAPRLVTSPGQTPAEILDAAAGAEVILAGSGPRFTDEVLAGLSCRGIVRYGVGTDSIDLDAARRHGIAVARVSDYGTEAVAFHAVAAAVALVRRLPEADRATRGGAWGFADLRPLHLPSHLTVGVIGFGRIGRQAAAYLAGFGFALQAYDEYVDIPAETGVVQTDLASLLTNSDVVLLHAPGNPDGSPLLGAAELSTMRPGSILVNTARGSLIDLPALVAGLRDNRPGLAGLDVYPQEPFDVTGFAGVEDRLLLSPHMAWYTEESEEDLRRKAADEAVRLLTGEPLRDPVVTPEQPGGTA